MCYPQPQVYRGILGAVKTTLISRVPPKMPFAALESGYRETSRPLGSGKVLWLPSLLFPLCPCSLSPVPALILLGPAPACIPYEAFQDHQHLIAIFWGRGGSI